MTLSDLLKKYREENDLSQREFARRCGLSNSLISILEMGVNPQTGKKMDPDLRTYRRLAEGMGMTVQQLFDLLRTHGGNVPDESLSESDIDFLEAIHQDPRLGLLFDRSRKMKPEDVDFMIQMADRILKERDGE